jgi:hypothetical protein
MNWETSNYKPIEKTLFGDKLRARLLSGVKARRFPNRRACASIGSERVLFIGT